MSQTSLTEPKKSDKTKTEILELIKSNSNDISYEIVLGKNPKLKEFERTLFNKQKTDLISCINCREVFTHTKTSGTGTIMAVDKCRINLEKQPKMDQFFAKKPLNLNAIKSEITNSVVLCCAIDIRSLNLIEVEGFRSLAQKFIDIGDTYGSVNVNDILPIAQTVSNRVPKVYNKIKEKLFNLCKEIGGIGVTQDLWKFDMTGAH
jgi:hypothetical protein